LILGPKSTQQKIYSEIIVGWGEMKIFLAVHEQKQQQMWYIEVSDENSPCIQ
jgi:hypothetical protein